MPTVEFSYPELIKLLGGKHAVRGLSERIPMMGVSLETIDEEKLVVEVFPNRPDLLSVEGFARALKGFIGIETGLVGYRTLPSNLEMRIDASVKDVRPFAGAAAITGVSIDDNKLKSLMNIQEKLHLTHGRNRMRVAIGVHDAKRLKPPYTYKAVKPAEISFVPLDTDREMSLPQILQRHPKGRDYAWTLEGLKKYPVIVDSKNQVLSFPPVINGELTRVTENTKELFIEVTGWDKIAVDQAVNIVVTSIADRGGEILEVKLT